MVIALVLAGVAAATLVCWDGDLGHRYSGGSAVGVPMVRGSDYSFGVGAVTAGDSSVRVEDVRLRGASRGVDLVGAVLYPTGCFGTGAARGFPPCRSERHEPARDAKVPAHRQYLLIVGLRSKRPGAFRVFGADVLYRTRWHGIELRKRAHIGNEIDLCSPAPCDPPAPDDNS
jgi:hypothetical protein